MTGGEDGTPSSGKRDFGKCSGAIGGRWSTRGATLKKGIVENLKFWCELTCREWATLRRKRRESPREGRNSMPKKRNWGIGKRWSIDLRSSGGKGKEAELS